MTKRNLALSVLFTLAIILSWWFIQHTARTLIILPQEQPNLPDSFMTNTIYSKINAQGQLKMRVYSPHIVNYPKDNTSLYQSPHIIIYKQNKQPWNITADKGKTLNGSDEVIVWQNVKIHQAKGPNNQSITMLTSYLKYFTKPEIAITQKPVTITQPGTVVHSVGLHANLKKDTIDLLSQARGVYVPAKAQ